MTGHLYVLGKDADKPLPIEDAQAEFQIQWRVARHAHVDLLSKIAGHWVTKLHNHGGKPLTARQVKYIRNEAQTIADAALALVAALDAAIRVTERAEKGRKP